MIKAFRRPAIAGAILLAGQAAASAQSGSSKTETPFDRQLARIDIGISGTGEFTSSTTGTNYLQQNVQLNPSNTLGYLVTARYIAKPWFGLEYNYGYARYSDNFVITNTSASPTSASGLVLDVQTNAKEYSFGYVVHAPERFQPYGLHPYASVGAGTMGFTPTKGGGQGLLVQARAAYYYNVGVEAPVINEHFGLRLHFRQVLFNAPDYETNYFRNGKHAITTEPAFGFYIRF